MATFWAKDSEKLYQPPGNFRDYTTILGASLEGAVLDVGCNRAWLAGLAKNYTGLEPNEQAVLAARSYWASRLNLGAEDMSRKIMIGRGEELPFAEATFDTIFAKDVLEHSREPDRVLSEFSRVLRKGGVLYLSTPDAQKWVWNDPTHWRPYPRAAHRAIAGSFNFEILAEAYESILPGTQHLARRWGAQSPFFVRWLARAGLCPRNVISLLRKRG